MQETYNIYKQQQQADKKQKQEFITRCITVTSHLKGVSLDLFKLLLVLSIKYDTKW